MELELDWNIFGDRLALIEIDVTIFNWSVSINNRKCNQIAIILIRNLLKPTADPMTENYN